MSDAINPLPPQPLACPGCGQQLDISAESAGQLIRCPFCECEFSLPGEPSELAVVDDTPPETAETDPQSAFDTLRIQNYTALKMGAIRSRSWWMIGLIMALVILLDMLIKMVVFITVRHSWGWWPTCELAVALLAGWFAVHAHRWAKKFKQEIERSSLPEPTVPPDYSTLGDGSERWKQLENVR